MQYKYINLTGHEVHELRSGLRIEANAPKLEVSYTTELVHLVDGATAEKVTNHLVGDLPEPQEGVIYIVNQLTLNCVPEGRIDIMAPKKVVRYKNGPHKNEVRGCIGFRVK